MCGAASRASVKSARAFAFSVQSQCFSSSSSAGRITPVAALGTSTSSGPSSSTNEAAFSGRRRCRGGASARRRARGARRRSPRPPVVPQVADRDARRAERRRSGARSPCRSRASRPVTRTDLPAKTATAGCGSDAAAWLGIVSQPSRSVGSSGPSSAFEDAKARRSSSSHLLLARSAGPGGPPGGRATRSLDARADLVGEVRRRRADERVDVVDGGLASPVRDRSSSARLYRCLGRRAAPPPGRRPAPRHRRLLELQLHRRRSTRSRTARSRSPTRPCASRSARSSSPRSRSARERSLRVARGDVALMSSRPRSASG